MPYTISQIAEQFGLARSTLLYCDRIGLLTPRGRSGADYRLYSEDDRRRMEEISRLRGAGLPLRAVAKLLDGGSSRRTEILHRRLQDINDEIQRLRRQQSFIVSLLNDSAIVRSTRLLTKEKWGEYLRKAGLDEDGMDRWHAEFEMSSPEAHQDFLESLGLASEEIRLIREGSRAHGAKRPTKKKGKPVP